MWKRCGLCLLLLLAGLSFSSLAFSEENPLAAGVWEWAADKDKAQVTEKLIEAVMLVERQEKRFTTLEEKLKLAEERLTTSSASFEESLRLKNLEIAATTRRLWTARTKTVVYTVLGIAGGGLVGYAVGSLTQ